MGDRTWLGSVGILLLVLLGTGALAPAGAGAAAKKRKKARPNIVVVMTDDQDAASIRYMPQLRRLVVGKGTTFQNSVVTYSFCCPSRATFYTGQYAHNHRVYTNKAPYGGYRRLAPTVRNTLPVWLTRSGYRTGLIGELVNGYASSRVPPGWHEWHAAVAPGYHGFVLNQNGRIVRYGNPTVASEKAYATDVFASMAVRFIHRNAPRKKPFFLQVAPPAPHAEEPSICNCGINNPRAAPRHEGAFAGISLPKPPNYDEADVSDKPLLVRSMTRIPPFGEAAVTNMYRSRLESLLAVDDMVGSILRALRQKRELGNTVFMFTSDNGFLHGEHRWRTGKVLPYEPSIRVPLVMRGPGIPKDRKLRQLVSNVDWAPTILDYAKARAGRRQDGLSLRRVFNNRRRGFGRAVLLESYFNAFGEYGNRGPRIVYDGVRTDRYMYARYESGEEELYDLAADPFELQSRHLDPAYTSIKASLRRLTGRLKRCAGRACRDARATTSTIRGVTRREAAVGRPAPRRTP